MSILESLTRFCWVDNGGITRAKAAWHSNLAGALRFGVGLSMAQQAIPMMSDTLVAETGLSPVGEVRLHADLETLTKLPFAPHSSMVLGDMRLLSGEAWGHCPRSFLKNQVQAAAALGFEVCASFENEFFLFNADDTPLDSSNYATLGAFNDASTVIIEILESLEAAGLIPEMYYPESGTGQHEISIVPSFGVKAADQQVIFKAIVHGVAAKHGLKASFAAKPILETAGSGCHLHLSLWQSGRNAFYAPDGLEKLSRVAYQSIAGVLKHLPGLCALTVPSVNSYRRLQPGWWAGAYNCYGLDNREAAVRVASSHLLHNADSSGKSTNFELKTCDASANPYIALGGLIAVVLDGIRLQLEPPEALNVSPSSLSPDQLAARGIQALPNSLEEALQHLQQNTVLNNALGDLATSYVAVRQTEATYFAAHPEEELMRHRYVY